jgi:hypothetical protein
MHGLCGVCRNPHIGNDRLPFRRRSRRPGPADQWPMSAECGHRPIWPGRDGSPRPGSTGRPDPTSPRTSAATPRPRRTPHHRASRDTPSPHGCRLHVPLPGSDTAGRSNGRAPCHRDPGGRTTGRRGSDGRPDTAAARTGSPSRSRPPASARSARDRSRADPYCRKARRRAGPGAARRFRRRSPRRASPSRR